MKIQTSSLRVRVLDSISAPLELHTPRAIEIPDELFRNENYLVVRVGESWFSFCRKGEAMMIHFCSRDARSARESGEIFIDWLFGHYGWCRMIIATIKKRSLQRLAARCGFREFSRRGDVLAMARIR
jgi:hypothetical protein